MCHPDFAEVIRAIICAIVELNAISAEEPRRHHTNHSHWSMREVGRRSEKSDLMENNGRECCEAECEMAVDTGARRGERRSIRDIGEIRSINIPLVYAVLPGEIVASHQVSECVEVQETRRRTSSFF